MKGHLNTACSEFSSHVRLLLTRSPHLIPQDKCDNSRATTSISSATSSTNNASIDYGQSVKFSVSVNGIALSSS